MCRADTTDFVYAQYGEPKIEGLSWFIWDEVFKRPVDQRPGFGRSNRGRLILDEIRNYFLNCPWNKVYEFIEFMVRACDRSHSHLAKWFNEALERELSGYRFIEGQVVDITDQQELEMLTEALRDTRFAGVSAHLQRALELYANREKPDYRNSIKESISAVEAMAKILTGEDKATLDGALKILEKNGQLHKALKDGFAKLYGYTSDEQGIRHAMMEDPGLSATDAKYFLLSCTSFANYLKAQMPA